MSLAHSDPRCVHPWRVWSGYVICRGCRRVLDATPDRVTAAARENQAGAMLRGLALEGDQILRRERYGA